MKIPLSYGTFGIILVPLFLLSQGLRNLTPQGSPLVAYLWIKPPYSNILLVRHSITGAGERSKNPFIASKQKRKDKRRREPENLFLQARLEIWAYFSDPRPALGGSERELERQVQLKVEAGL